MNINNRILAFIKYLDVSQAKFAKTINVAPNTLSSYFSKNVSPRSETVQKILEMHSNLNARWLLTGEGDMLNKKTQNTGQLVVGNNNISEIGNSIGDKAIQTGEAEFKKELILKDKEIELLKKEVEMLQKQIDFYEKQLGQ